MRDLMTALAVDIGVGTGGRVEVGGSRSKVKCRPRHQASGRSEWRDMIDQKAGVGVWEWVWVVCGRVQGCGTGQSDTGN